MEPRNWLASASATPPAAPASPSNGYPQAGVPGVSDPTYPGPHWYYKMAEELRAIITAAGLTPADTNLGQVLAAMQAGFGLAKSKASNGYNTLPGGVIVQWLSGTTDATNGVDKVFTLPTTFPNAIRQVVQSFNESALPFNDVTEPLHLTAKTTSSVTLRCYTGANNGFSLFAIGD